MNTFAPSRGCPKSVVTLPVITAFCAWAAAPGTVSNTPSNALAIACARVMMVISLAEDDWEEKLRLLDRRQRQRPQRASAVCELWQPHTGWDERQSDLACQTTRW